MDAAVEGFVFSEEVESETAEDAEVGDGVARAGAAEVLAEDDVQDPVALVLDGPVAAHGLGEESDVQRQAAEVVAPFDGDLVADLPGGLDQADAAQAGPLGPVGEPVDGLALPVAAGLQAAMAFLDGGEGGQPRIPPFDGVVEIGLDLFVGGALVAFEGQHVVGIGSMISRAVSFWQCRASAVTMQPASSSCRNSAGTAVISLLFSATNDWPSVSPLSVAQTLTR